MATSIFTPCAGAVTKINLCDGASASPGGLFNITIDGTRRLSFPISSFVMEQQGNYQFLHALDNFIYYYNFGDRIGEMTVAGFGFTEKTCVPASGTRPATTEDNSICRLIGFYEAYKQSTRRQAITVGTHVCGVYRGFLTGMRLEVSAGSFGMPVGQWSLRFHVFERVRPRP